MKQIVLFFFMLCISSNILVKGQATTSPQEITLTVLADDEREIKDLQPDMPSVPITRSIVLQPVYSYLYNKVVSLDFTETFSAVNVVITNQATGETIHSETYSNPAALCIDLNGESSGNYLIEIEADETLLIGTFNL